MCLYIGLQDVLHSRNVAFALALEEVEDFRVELEVDRSAPAWGLPHGVLPELFTKFGALGRVRVMVEFASILHRPNFGERSSLDIFFCHADLLAKRKSIECDQHVLCV